MKFSNLLFLVGALQLCSASRILFIIPMPSKSHYHLGERLIEELIKKGHEVTIMSPFKKSQPLKNLTEIIMPDVSKELFGAMPQNTDGRFGMRNINPLAFLRYTHMESLFSEATLSHPPVQQLIRSNQKFDLVIGECFLIEAILVGFAYRFNAPIVGIATFMPNTWANEMVGNPYPASYVPDPMLAYSDKMNFKERLTNFLFTTIRQIHHYVWYLPNQDVVMRKYFGKDMPYIKDILMNTSLVLVNHHYSLAFPRPYLPNMVEVGGYHVKPPKPLPQDLQKFMDEAKDGVIYFSMGSNLQSSEFPKEKFDEIINAFSKLKERVLWKFESENTPNLPKNVKISKWLPQSDILAHPKVKLFITHGGLLSFTESVLRGVPVLGIPIFGDQPQNVKHFVNMGLGLKVDYDDLEKKDVLYKAIQEMLNNPMYRNNVKARSKILQDLPMAPIDTAIYWLEYVMRYKGAPHLRSGAQDLSWYQLYLFDVYAYVGVALLGVAFVTCKVTCYISRTLCGKKNKKVGSTKKKN